MRIEKVRVLVADGDTALANRISNYLRESGFDTKVVNDAFLLRKLSVEWKPQFLLIDLLFPGLYAQECLKFLNMRGLLGPGGVHVVVLSHHTAELNVRNCLEAGADDFVVKPFQLIDVLQRMALLVQTKKYNFAALSSNQQLKTRNDLEMVQLMIRAANQSKAPQDLRFELITMVSLALRAVRTSVIECSGDRKKIRVTRSSDDEGLQNLSLELRKYPEIEYVLRTEKPLFVESLEKDLTLSFVKHEVKSIQFDSMMVLPLGRAGDFHGCLSIRMPKDCKKLSLVDIKLAEIAAQIIALTWKFPIAKGAQRAS